MAESQPEMQSESSTPAKALESKETNGSSNNESKVDARTEQNDKFSVHVKKEYLLDKRPPSLGEIPETVPEEEPPVRGDDRDNNKHGGKRGKKFNKKKGKKRPRDARTPNSEKVCLAVVRGDKCPYGESCKFSHDLMEFLKTRPEDIDTVEGGCPMFNAMGYCTFGAMCRLGSCHLIKSTGESLRKDGVVQPPPIQNILPREVIVQLRKRTFPFKTQYRHKDRREKFQKNKKRGGDSDDKDNGSDVKPDAPTNASEKESEKKEEPAPVAVEKQEEPVPATESKNSASEEPAAETNDDKAKTPSEPFKAISDPFRPTFAPEMANTTPLPSKTKKIIDFSNKVYVAPLTTVGNLPFRRIMKKFGADITCGEMAMAGNLLEGKPSEWALLKRHPDEDIFGIQLASGYPDQFTRIAEVVESHLDVDFVDMNLGCPLDIVCNKGAGSSLMLRSNNLKGILQGVTTTLSCPVTVKMRTGWDTNKPFAHQLVSKIQSWEVDGIAAIMIHGRSRLQRYQQRADWDYISTVATSQDDALPKLPVIGNGDIFSYTEYEEFTSREGLSSAAMLARGALIKPWLPTEIKERRHWDISASERLDILKDFVKFGLMHWGSDDQGVNNTRRFLLEWMSFLHRYIPIGIMEGGYLQQLNHRPPAHMCGRSDLETLFLSGHSHDWVKISEMLLGPVPEGFRFEPKHKARSYK